MRHFFLTALLAVISVATAAEPLAIKPVKTWKELSEQTPIALKDGGTVRFGIEALAAPVNAGVVLYCMTDQVRVETLRNTLAEECIGPLRLKVEIPGLEKLERKIQSEQAQSRIKELVAQGRALYVQFIPVADKRGCRISVLNKAAEVLAAADISASKEVILPWVAFVDDYSREQQAVELIFADDKPRGPSQDVVAAMGGISVPNVDGTHPVLYVLPDGKRGEIDFKDDLALPGFLQFTGETKKHPSALKPAVTISITKSNLEITTPLAFECSFFSDKFIARWWLNGKPVEKFPQPASLARNGGGLVSYHKQATLNLRFVPEAIGAKKGDKVAVQLLYCPDGARNIGPNAMMKMLASADRDDNDVTKVLRFPILSNVVEFEAE